LFPKFVVVDSFTGALHEYDVEGTTFSPYGLVKSSDGKGVLFKLSAGPLRRLAEICAICNDAKVVYHQVIKSFRITQPIDSFNITGEIFVYECW
jgi:P-type Ca2+ transporter type 2A